jgi:valyl-tRNA synthetase
MVLDKDGKKMSKSKGNGIDPLEMIEKYGTDATRLSLIIGNTPGNDSRMSEEKIADYRNFTNKLWNISRFMLMNIGERVTSNEGRFEAKTLADKWILGRLMTVSKQVTDNIEKYNFSFAGEQLRDFTWNELADWYLEIAKIEGNKSEMLNYILNTILKLWHPFMPFVTEAIWGEVYGNERMLMVEKWPLSVIPTEPEGRVEESLVQFQTIQKIITGIRSIRAENKIEPAKKLNVMMSAGDTVTLWQENAEVIKGLARLESLIIEEKTEKPANAIGFVESGVEVFISLEGVLDVAKEKERLTKEIAQLKGYVAGLEKKLSNKEFVNNAPAEVVEKEKAKLEEGKSKLEKLEGQFKQIN